ncbi:hypothetical protein WJX73_004482 [Symbiochloris irregularis]
MELQNASLGTMPDAWTEPGAFPSLAFMNLNNVSLSGLPEGAAGAWPAMSQLAVTNSHLVNGNIPSSWGAADGFLVSAISIDLSGSGLTGTLPAWEGGYWPNLEELNLARNKLSGTLPAWSGGTFRKLAWLNLSNNKLVGVVAKQSSFSRSNIDLGGNTELEGNIPAAWRGTDVEVQIPWLSKYNTHGRRKPFSFCWWASAPKNLSLMKCKTLPESHNSGKIGLQVSSWAAKNSAYMVTQILVD